MTRPSTPQGCTNLKLRQLSRMVTRHYDHHMATLGLKNTQYALLSHVIRLGPVRPGELAKHMQMDASTLTRNLQPMAARGLLTIGAGDNARSRRVEATAAGHALRTQCQQAWKAAQLALNAQLGVERVSALHALLDSCVALLDAAPGQAATAMATPVAITPALDQAPAVGP